MNDKITKTISKISAFPYDYDIIKRELYYDIEAQILKPDSQFELGIGEMCLFKYFEHPDHRIEE